MITVTADYALADAEVVVEVCLIQCMACNLNRLVFYYLGHSAIYLWFPLVEDTLISTV